MTVSAQVAIYPLRQERLTPAISAVRDALNASGFEPDVAPMSTTVTGEGAILFRALVQAFVRAGALGHVVMVVTVSNACPQARDRTAGRLAALRAWRSRLRGVVHHPARAAGGPWRARAARTSPGSVCRGAERARGGLRDGHFTR